MRSAATSFLCWDYLMSLIAAFHSPPVHVMTSSLDLSSRVEFSGSQSNIGDWAYLPGWSCRTRCPSQGLLSCVFPGLRSNDSRRALWSAIGRTSLFHLIICKPKGRIILDTTPQTGKNICMYIYIYMCVCMCIYIYTYSMQIIFIYRFIYSCVNLPLVSRMYLIVNL